MQLFFEKKFCEAGMEHDDYGNEEEFMDENQDEQIGIGEDEEILDEFILEEGEDIEEKLKERGLIPQHTQEEKQILDELDAMEHVEDPNAALIDDSLCSFTLHTGLIFLLFFALLCITIILSRFYIFDCHNRNQRKRNLGCFRQRR